MRIQKSLNITKKQIDRIVSKICTIYADHVADCLKTKHSKFVMFEDDELGWHAYDIFYCRPGEVEIRCGTSSPSKQAMKLSVIVDSLDIKKE